jgi:hypothetical protein
MVGTSLASGSTGSDGYIYIQEQKQNWMVGTTLASGSTGYGILSNRGRMDWLGPSWAAGLLVLMVQSPWDQRHERWVTIYPGRWFLLILMISNTLRQRGMEAVS